MTRSKPFTEDDSRHGTYAGTIQHWKAGTPTCDPCALAGRRQRKRNELARINGDPGLCELGWAAWRILLNVPRNQLVDATGMLHDRLHRYEVAGPEALVHRATRDRILACAVPAWTPVGVQRRLQALTALGWSMREVAQRAGVSEGACARLRSRKTLKHVRINFARTIVAVYEDLSMALPPSGISAGETRNEALRRRYLPPLAWDSIDDPAERPIRGSNRRHNHDVDHAVVARFMGGENLSTTQAEKHAITSLWIAAGRSQGELERRTGWNVTRYTDDLEETG